MRDQVVTFKTAKLAKNKGFNHGLLDRLDYYTIKENGYDEGILNHVYVGIPAPTQSLLQRWLREEHNIQIYAYPDTLDGSNKFRDYVAYINNVALNNAKDEEFQTYEEALEFGLYTALTRLT